MVFSGLLCQYDWSVHVHVYVPRWKRILVIKGGGGGGGGQDSDEAFLCSDRR